jgi:hypothetical protein
MAGIPCGVLGWIQLFPDNRLLCSRPLLLIRSVAIPFGLASRLHTFTFRVICVSPVRVISREKSQPVHRGLLESRVSFHDNTIHIAPLEGQFSCDGTLPGIAYFAPRLIQRLGQTPVAALPIEARPTRPMFPGSPLRKDCLPFSVHPARFKRG